MLIQNKKPTMAYNRSFYSDILIDDEQRVYEEQALLLDEWCKDKEEVSFDGYGTLKIGDLISVSYLPDSQKYLYTFPPIWGKVVKVGESDEDISIEFNGKETNIVPSERLSYFGDHRGYTISCGQYVMK